MLKQGGSLSPKDAEKLEEQLKKKPKDEEAPIQLLSYYATPPAGADLAIVKTARAKHISWVIENDPKTGLGLFAIATGVYRLHCQGDELADPEAFRRAEEMWLERVKRNSGDSGIRASAIDAIQFCAPESAEPLLTEAKDSAAFRALVRLCRSGHNWKVVSEWRSAGSDPAFRERPFAQKALRVLEAATDKDELVAAAITLLRDGAIP